MVKEISEKEEYIRLSYAVSNDDIIKGLDRIKKLLKKDEPADLSLDTNLKNLFNIY